MNYKEYLKTENWQKKRRKVFALHSKRCAVCRKKKATNVHHKSYKRLGDETKRDLIPLCQFHHNEIHKFANQQKINIWQATEQYIKKYRKKPKKKWSYLTPFEREKYLRTGNI